jgi:hypothetical protein
MMGRRLFPSYEIGRARLAGPGESGTVHLRLSAFIRG